MEPDRVFIDIRTCDLTLSQVMNEIAKLHADNKVDVRDIHGRRLLRDSGAPQEPEVTSWDAEGSR